MRRYIEELKSILPEKEEYLKDLIKRRACEKTIEVAIDSLIDVAAMIISAQKLGLPVSEENVFDILVKNNIIGNDFSEKLKAMKGFRNVLIHRYAHIDDELVHDHINQYLGDFIKFKELIEQYLARFQEKKHKKLH